MTYLHYKLDQITLQITSKLKYNLKSFLQGMYKIHNG